MFRVISRSDHHHGEIDDAIVLPYEMRQRGRFRVSSKTGLDVGVFLPRGDVLKNGDCLFTECGKVFRVEAQEEEVVTAEAKDWLTFAKACYHMGNRHVPMEIGERWLRFQPDHVLQEMVELFGLECQQHQAMFNPESGAYHGGGHSHGEHSH
ncbi:urease accessory protein UreE [Vibrio parahaemolyticus]|nr:urease accessory protein UreE [Vibrio parahaemolyticus]MDF5543700.1 urease accessory protein UreE [Vibrio parahaemolyticus]